MEGYHGRRPWGTDPPDPLLVLLTQPDTRVTVGAPDAAGLAARLEELVPRLGEWQDVTERFSRGLRLATERGEALVLS